MVLFQYSMHFLPAKEIFTGLHANKCNQQLQKVIVYGAMFHKKLTPFVTFDVDTIT